MIIDNYIDDIPVSCINHAAVEFHVPARLIVSVLRIEHGAIGVIRKNKNGTYDMGLDANQFLLATYPEKIRLF